MLPSLVTAAIKNLKFQISFFFHDSARSTKRCKQHGAVDAYRRVLAIDASGTSFDFTVVFSASRVFIDLY